MRWFIVLGVGLAGSLPQFLQQGFVPQVTQNMSIVLGVLAINFLFLAASSWHFKRYGVYQALASAQVILDLVIVTAVIYGNGGIENVAVMLYVIPIIMSGALLGRRAIYATGVVASIAYDTLIALDYVGWVKTQSGLAPALHTNTDYVVQTLFFVPAMLLTITAITDFVAKLVRERTELAVELKAETTQRAEIEAILETMGSALVAVDQEGNIKLVNDSFEELTGWQRQEVLGVSIEKILPLLDENGRRVKAGERPLLQLARRHLDGQTPGVQHLSQYYYSRKDGSLFPFVSSLAPIVLRNEIIGGTTVFDDATSTKKIQQLKSNFVALASHQLKTPVGEIQGYVENMIQGITGPLNKKQLEYLKSIDEITIHAIKLLTDLLDITVIEKGDLLINLQPVPLADIVDKGVQIYQDRLQQKNLKINVVPPPEAITVEADSSKLVEVFGNVLANAVSYTRQNTAITVETGEEGDYGVIRVTDQGRGMSQKVIDSIFQKDNVLSAAPEAEGGTGIGLYLAKQLVSLQKGDIGVVSSSDKGTTIVIKVPLGGKHG